MNEYDLELNQLCISKDNGERNALAIKLLDVSLTDPTKVAELQRALFKAIEIHNYQQVGTLVWCAGHFDCSEYKADLRTIVAHAGFEASELAKNILNELEG
ncbi:hypothetical protein Q1W73_08890 [Asticcacaulis sp. ZE23SCel15]|uniref:hypothetical protein n=1 Tax=Asticcacaulis sp. ZE23SCel15 TaxID=3059027 RepID=UPI00265E8E90|nr:hypothetical protein [Asticcacaulis sp. ZE23SCel15]WKL55823.1 hypothetical protein Q1W73_08890 [Asticcacaulis sp. ZE23SCel15]